MLADGSVLLVPKMDLIVVLMILALRITMAIRMDNATGGVSGFDGIRR